MWLVGLVICAGWIFSICLHEFSHALFAYWGGDTSVKNKGSLIFNPFKRYTPHGHNIVLPLLFLLTAGVWLPGGSTYIDKNKLRNRFWKSATSAAGSITNIVIALLLSSYFQTCTKGNLLINDKSLLPISIAGIVYLQVFSAIFNLLPIPGLDGYGIIEPWLSNNILSNLAHFKKYSTITIIGAFWWSIFTFDIIKLIVYKFFEIPDAFVNAAFLSFQNFIYTFISFVVFMSVIWSWGLNYQEHSIEKGVASGKKKVISTPQSYPNHPKAPSPKGGTSVKEKVTLSTQVHPETRKRAIALAGYEKQRIERLLNSVRLKNPARSEQWYWEKIIYDMERDRGF